MKNMFTKTVVAKDREGNVQGTGSIDLYTKDKAGLDQACKDYKVEDLVSLINKQRKTDKRNSLARPQSASAQLTKLGKTNPEVQKRIEALLAELV